MTAYADVELYRPKLHFSPKRGWMNDPNGLIRLDGVWHAFFQYYPDGVTHGPMHWGHATSPDLVTWTEQPIALYPDANGTCFSGSAIETALGEVELFYTGHRVGPDGHDLQTQCVAHASRDMATFAKDDANPIIANPGLRAFRDPKVLWHAPTQRWLMVVTHGQSIGFYSSIDRRSWALESTFGERDGRHGSGPWECPDLVEMGGPDGRRYWVLVVGIGDGAFGGGSGTQYFIGEFDGGRFRNLNPPETVLWLDCGRDFYAAQTFFAKDREEPIVLAWASNWLYARQTPTKRFRGTFSLPRQLRLVQSAAGLRVAAIVPQQVAAQFERLDVESGSVVPNSGSFRFVNRIEDGEMISFCLFGEAIPQISLRRTGGHLTLRLRRTSSPAIEHFDHDYTTSLPASEKINTIEVFVDCGLVEICINNGTAWATNLEFPLNPAGIVQIDRNQLTERRR